MDATEPFGLVAKYEKEFWVAVCLSMMFFFAGLVGEGWMVCLVLTFESRLSHSVACQLMLGVVLQMGTFGTEKSPGPSGSGGPPDAAAGNGGAAGPTLAEFRWSFLVRRLCFLFYLRRLWAGLGTYLKNFTRLK